MGFNIYNILIIAGVIQGFIFTAVVLFNKKYHAKSTYFLVALIFCYSVGNLMYILPDIGTIPLLNMYAYIYLPLAAIDAPILYYYVVLFLNPSKKISLLEKMLFLPFITFLIITLYFRLKVYLELDVIDPINPSYRFMLLFVEMFSVVFSILLLSISIHKIIVFEKKNKMYDKVIVQPDINWLKLTLSIILIFTLLWGYLTIRNIFYTSGETVYYSLWLGMAALIYWLGHIGVYKYGIISERNKIRQYLEKNNLFNNSGTSTKSSVSKYKNEHISALENLLIHEKIYLNSNLTLEKVAEHMQLSPSYLSRIIHSELNTSFPDFLNSLRVDEAKIYLSNPEFSSYTIVAIGLEAGFNSRSSFYNVFKKVTGKTPMAFQKENLSV